MNHMKSQHPSQKKCRYFALAACDFDAETCWYSHRSNKQEEESTSVDHSCKDCDDKLLSKSDLMKHRKVMHINKVFECRYYLQGKCTLSESSCWFLPHKKMMKMKMS